MSAILIGILTLIFIILFGDWGRLAPRSIIWTSPGSRRKCSVCSQSLRRQGCSDNIRHKGGEHERQE